jgi:hypothetical protein
MLALVAHRFDGRFFAEEDHRVGGADAVLADLREIAIG